MAVQASDPLASWLGESVQEIVSPALYSACNLKEFSIKAVIK